MLAALERVAEVLARRWDAPGFRPAGSGQLLHRGLWCVRMILPPDARPPNSPRSAVKRSVLLPLLFAFLGVALGRTLAADDRLAFFEKKIRPVLVEHCYSCHSAGAEELGGKLLLDSRDGMLGGGESGPVLAAGKPDDSLLMQALRWDGIDMPPDGPLPDPVIKDFENWIAMGATDPRRGQTANEETAAAVDHEARWSFCPRSDPDLPIVQDTQWPWDPIDHFALASMEDVGLSPTHDADARTLGRRLYYDLIGLPPTQTQLDTFVRECETDRQRAVERLVDTLLGSQQFGVRWGRHWLDVARYGESNGDDGLGRNATFPHAWRYRDYVVDAFNSDVPYDRFLTEQIAGDLLPAEDATQGNRQLVATGFLAIGSKPAVAMNKNFAMDVVDDQINAVCTAVMGLSVACARCHDHKHDPIPTRDYYALAGIFTSTQTLYGAAGNEKLTAPPTPLHELQQPEAGEQASPALAMGVREKEKPADCKIHINGEGAKLGPVVPRGTLTVYQKVAADERTLRSGLDISSNTSGRAELACWLADPDHPQTARVIVNRVWLHLFGHGIVGTPDDFGVYGARPTHPLLLDYLAERLVQHGWSLKRLIREIVLSRTYQLDSRCDPQLVRD